MMASISRAQPYNNSQHRPVSRPARAIGIQHGEDSQCQEAVSGRRLARPPTIRTAIPPCPPQRGRGGYPVRGRAGWNRRGRGGYNNGGNMSDADRRGGANVGRSEQPGTTWRGRPNVDSRPGRTTYANASWHRNNQASASSFKNPATTRPTTSRLHPTNEPNKFTFHTLPPRPPSSSSALVTQNNSDSTGFTQLSVGSIDRSRNSEESSSTDRHITFAPCTQPQYSSHQQQPNFGANGAPVTFSDMHFPHSSFRGGLDQQPPSWAAQSMIAQSSTQSVPAKPVHIPTPAPPDATTEQQPSPSLSPKSTPDEARPAKRQRLDTPSEDASLSLPQSSALPCKPSPREAETNSQARASMSGEHRSSPHCSSDASNDSHRHKKKNESPRIKQEPRSPSPLVPLPTAKLVTSGSQRHAPMPENCMRTNPNHKICRDAWKREKCNELVKKGLRIIRTLIR